MGFLNRALVGMNPVRSRCPGPDRRREKNKGICRRFGPSLFMYGGDEQ